MNRYLVLFEKSADGFAAYVPDLPGCVAVGDTKDEAEQLIYDAIRFHLEGLREGGLPIPQNNVESEMMLVG